MSALASLGENDLCVLVWHYHDDDLPGPAAAVQLHIDNLAVEPARLRVRHFRIDETHSNSYSAWQRIGSPQQPNAQDYAGLEAAGRLAEVLPAPEVEISGNKAILRLDLPRQGVSLVRLAW